MTKRTLIALLASATLNVFFVGLGIGVVVTGARITPAPAAKARPLPNIWVASQALPQPDRFKFRSMLREKALAVQPKLKAIRMARQEAAGLIAAANFDPKAVSAVLARARAGEADARSDFDEAFVAYLSGMPQSERADLAGAMVRSGPRNVRQAIRADDAAAQAGAPGQSKPN